MVHRERVDYFEINQVIIPITDAPLDVIFLTKKKIPLHVVHWY